ncbi:hypothetical protein SVIOM342S_07257 [Streptomyces violaceorubidus]
MAPTGRPSALAEHAFSPHDAVMGAAARHLGRRRFLTVTAAAAALAFSTNLPARGAVAAPERSARISKDPFTLGVASGDPLPDSVLLWTRLAPEPFLEDGGMGTERVTVEWEVALDEYFAGVLFRGTADAHAEYNHSVHVDVKGLTPGTVYYYHGTGRPAVPPAALGHASPSSTSWTPVSTAPTRPTTTGRTPPGPSRTIRRAPSPAPRRSSGCSTAGRARRRCGT